MTATATRKLASFSIVRVLSPAITNLCVRAEGCEIFLWETCQFIVSSMGVYIFFLFFFLITYKDKWLH